MGSWIHLTQKRDQWSSVIKMVLNLHDLYMSEISFDQPSDYYFLKMVSASQSSNSFTYMYTRLFGTLCCLLPKCVTEFMFLYAYSTQPQYLAIK